MKSLTENLMFHIPARMGFQNIIGEIESIVRRGGVQEGLILVDRMQP